MVENKDGQALPLSRMTHRDKFTVISHSGCPFEKAFKKNSNDTTTRPANNNNDVMTSNALKLGFHRIYKAFHDITGQSRP